MTTAVDDPLVADYLRQLRVAARSLPRSARRELIADIRAHIHDALPAGASEADVRNVLDSLGPPDEIVAAARAAADNPGPPAHGLRDVITIVLLLIGGIVVPVIGWVIGVVLLWTSTSWTTGRKLVATLVWPGGLGFGLVVIGLALVVPSGQSGASTVCTSGIVAARGPNATTAATRLTAPHCLTTSQSGSSVPEWLVVVLFALLILAPIAVAVDLFRSAGRHQAPASTTTGPMAPVDA
jgi:hypothetical protein